MKFRIEYNSPVILTYALICSVILILSQIGVTIAGVPLMNGLFVLDPQFHPADPFWYFRLFSHVFGHADWLHLVSNFTLILLIGPILEEKYGSRDLIFMILVTALITGISQVIFYDTGLMGASGVAFMMILLGSYTQSRTGGIPLTFVLVAILWLGKEIYGAVMTENQISEFAHIIGGVTGGIFGFLLSGRKRKPAPSSTSPSPIIK